MGSCDRRNSIAWDRGRHRFLYAYGAPDGRRKTDRPYCRHSGGRGLDFHSLRCHHTAHNRDPTRKIYRLAHNARLGAMVTHIVCICRPVLVARGLDTKADEGYSAGRFARRPRIAGTIFQVIPDMDCLRISGLFCRPWDCLVDGIKTCSLRHFPKLIRYLFLLSN